MLFLRPGFYIVSALALLFAIYQIFRGPRMVSLLILKYLRRRRIAWVSLIAVTLCTTMVLVVISVMGGWLDMFEGMARGLTGDIVVKGPSLSGFPYYEDMVRAIEQTDGVAAAVPSIRTYGLVNISNRKTTAVQVLAYPIDQIGRVNRWPESLYRQHSAYADAGKPLPAGGPSFDPFAAGRAAGVERVIRVPLGLLPKEVPVRDRRAGTLGPAGPSDGGPTTDAAHSVWQKVGFDFMTGQLFAKDKLSGEDEAALLALSNDEDYTKAVQSLARQSRWPGIIPGAGVIDVRKGPDGKVQGREPWKYDLWAKLTVLGIGTGQEVDEKNKAEEQYWIVDDSRTQMWQYDNDTVYVPFDVLQKDLGMERKAAKRMQRVLAAREVWEAGKERAGGLVLPKPAVVAPADGHYVLTSYAGRNPREVGSADLKKGEPLTFKVIDAPQSDGTTEKHAAGVAGDKTFDLGPVPTGPDVADGPPDADWKLERQIEIPARASEIHVKVAPGADLYATRDNVAAAVRKVQADREQASAGAFALDDDLKVETWEQASELFIGAIKKEKLLVTLLFGIISVVAVFLIFCIFYMIVAEKTRDIGIIKSVGATSGGVAGIFLGYGLAIGIVGTGLGLLFSYLIVHNINEIHDWLGRALHVRIWNPEVYAFETIPNKMNPSEVTVIIGIAILSSVLGALVPAIRAARLHPVEALRWE